MQQLAKSLALSHSRQTEFAVFDEKGAMFVNIEDTSEIVKFDTKKLAVLARWPIAPGEEASGLAIDRKHTVCSLPARTKRWPS